MCSSPPAHLGLIHLKATLRKHGKDKIPAWSSKFTTVTAVPFPIAEPDVLFCRFLLTHLRAPHEVLEKWASIAAHDALLFIHETETLESENLALRDITGW